MNSVDCIWVSVNSVGLISCYLIFICVLWLRFCCVDVTLVFVGFDVVCLVAFGSVGCCVYLWVVALMAGCSVCFWWIGLCLV